MAATVRHRRCLVFSLPSLLRMLRHRLCLAFPLPSRLGHRLWLLRRQFHSNSAAMPCSPRLRQCLSVRSTLPSPLASTEQSSPTQDNPQTIINLLFRLGQQSTVGGARSFATDHDNQIVQTDFTFFISADFFTPLQPFLQPFLKRAVAISPSPRRFLSQQSSRMTSVINIRGIFILPTSN